ncbi:MAG: calmodulin [Pseudomonadota bacterium]
MKMILTTFTAMLFTIGGALAQVAFDSVDVDRDGFVSVEEAASIGISMEMHQTADADGDGLLSAEEFETIPQ